MSEPLVIAGSITIPFSYAAGAAASRFLVALRDERRILGSRCPGCSRVLVPARSFCPGCWVDTAGEVAVGPEGTLVTWTTVRIALPHLPPPPVTLGLVRLEGADTALLHVVAGDPQRLRSGMRVGPVWRQARSGSLLDIAHFAPVT